MKGRKPARGREPRGKRTKGGQKAREKQGAGRRKAVKGGKPATGAVAGSPPRAEVRARERRDSDRTLHNVAI